MNNSLSWFVVVAVIIACLVNSPEPVASTMTPPVRYTGTKWSEDVRNKAKACAKLANKTVKKDAEKVMVFNHCLRRFGATI